MKNISRSYGFKMCDALDVYDIVKHKTLIICKFYLGRAVRRGGVIRFGLNIGALGPKRLAYEVIFSSSLEIQSLEYQNGEIMLPRHFLYPGHPIIRQQELCKLFSLGETGAELFQRVINYNKSEVHVDVPSPETSLTLLFNQDVHTHRHIECSSIQLIKPFYNTGLNRYLRTEPVTIPANWQIGGCRLSSKMARKDHRL
ncbi:hypothetical protein NQ317_013364 [Molorchus minor]|uniref:Uncharacterized protein n=1 Tax=Molorchus minor TaxID=1323400 RepID=A0ABQ9IRQ5_9CUCU|nr:hypothetical protein NQ317_013364 [Molorchus minor]